MTAVEDRLAEIEARAAAATEGPWEAEHADKSDWLTEAIAADGQAEDHEPVSLVRVQGVPHGGSFVASPSWPFRNGHNDTEFIAAARTDVPALTAALRAVLAVHRPVWCDNHDVYMCVHCGHHLPDGAPDCPTVHAISAALDGAR